MAFKKISSKKYNLIKHEKYLRKNVFFTKDKWPHFDLLFSDIKTLSKKMPSNSKVLFIERTNLYGSISLLAPFFNRQYVASIDCSEKSIKSRGSYNKSLIDIDKIIPFYSIDQKNYLKIIEKKYKSDLIIIPNLIHHIPYHIPFFKNLKKLLNPRGKIYVFEPLVRELHQAPDDYLRYTPFGLKKIFEDLGYKNIEYKLEGGPFSVISYCYDQSLQFLPKKIKEKETSYFLNNLLPKLNKFEKKYKKNLIRSHSSFPMSYSVLAKKNDL